MKQADWPVFPQARSETKPGRSETQLSALMVFTPRTEE